MDKRDIKALKNIVISHKMGLIKAKEVLGGRLSYSLVKDCEYLLRQLDKEEKSLK